MRARVMRQWPGCIVSGLCVLVVLPHVLQAQSAARPLEIEDAIRVREVVNDGTAGGFSPDGRSLSYTVLDAGRARERVDWESGNTATGVPMEMQGATVWVTHIENGEQIEVGSPASTSWGPAWSPDGRFLAFYSNQDGPVRLWVWEAATRQVRRVSDATVRLWIGLGWIVWTPDSKHLLTTLVPDRLTLARPNPESTGDLAPPDGGSDSRAAVRGATVTVYHAPAQVATPSVAPTADVPGPTILDTISVATADIGIVELASGAVRRLARGVNTVGLWLSPDGTRLAYLHWVASQRNTWNSFYDLTVVRLAGGTPRVVAPLVRLEVGSSAVRWSPDGRRLGYVALGPTGSGAYVVLPDAGSPTLLTRGPHPEFSDRMNGLLWTPRGDALLLVGGGRLWKASVADTVAVPLTAAGWDRDVLRLVPGAARNTVWSPDGGRSAVFTTQDRRTIRGGFWRVDLVSGRVTPLNEADKAYSGAVTTPDGRTVAYLAEGAQHAPDLWVAASDFRRPVRVTQVNPRLGRYTFGAGRLVEYRSAQGDTLRGALVLPANYQPGRRYPLVVRVYPGGREEAWRVARFGLDAWNRSFNAQLLATRGYAVLFPAAPTRLGTPMHDMADAILPAIDQVVALGIADPDRVGISGHSYGGYATIAMLVQSPRFKAAVMSAGAVDLVSNYGMMAPNGHAEGISWSEAGQGMIGGTLWQFRDRYVANSPIFTLDRVRTPLLIVHGEEDAGVPSWQSDAIFVGLRRLGREVEYRRYAGEGHVIGDQSIANLRDYWTAMVRWFDTHMRGPAPGP